METSIIIRTKNEEKWLGVVLERLNSQTYKNFEIIIVDSGSTDKTLNIAKKFNTRIIEIPQREFSYPHALNIGCENSKADKYFVFLSAHSIPISKTWLSDGIKDFTSDKIMGVYGMMQALPDGSIFEKIYWNSLKVFLYRFFGWKKEISHSGMGVLGFTHAIIRRDLWEKHKFDENYGAGGEDGEWSSYWFERGYKVIKDSNFSVAHSHGLNLFGLKKQQTYWSTLNKPRPYEKPDFRA